MISTGTGFCSAGVSVIRVSVKKKSAKTDDDLGSNSETDRCAARKSRQDSRLKSQESRVKSRNPHSMYEAIGGQRPPKDHWPQATKTPRAVSPPKKIKFQNWYSVELEKHFTLGTTTAFHRRWCHPAAGAPLLRNPCNPGKPNILAKPSKLREPPPLA